MLKVQMIFLRLPPSCFPSELIANDNMRKGHNGESTNNLALVFAKLNICRSYKRVMDDRFICLSLYFNFKIGITKYFVALRQGAPVGLRLGAVC